MENSKIDILEKNRQIITENYKDDTRIFYNMDELTSEQLSSYNAFMSLVENKTTEPYTQTYISNTPIKRFVNVSDANSDLKEILYDDLSSADKLTFDTFYNTFIK